MMFALKLLLSVQPCTVTDSTYPQHSQCDTSLHMLLHQRIMGDLLGYKQREPPNRENIQSNFKVYYSVIYAEPRKPRRARWYQSAGYQ